MSDTFGLDQFTPDEAGGLESETAAFRGTLRFGKVEYAVDLQWQTAVDNRSADGEARELAASGEERADFYCVRRGSRPQFGLGFANMGHKASLPVLATHVCQGKGSNFAAVYEVDGGYYLLAVVDDAILSDYERFVPTADEAGAILDQLLRINQPGDVIAPADLEIEGAREETIAEALSGRPPVRLKDVRSSSRVLRYGLIALVAAGAVFGAKTYYDRSMEARLDAELRATFEQAQEAVGLKEGQPKVPPMPWEGEAMGARAVEACFDEIRKFPLDIPGWPVSDLSCAPSGPGVAVTAYLGRDRTLEEGGTPITHAIHAVKDNGLDPILSMPAGGSQQSIAFTWVAGSVPKIPTDIETASISKVSESVLKIMETRRTTVAISPADSNEFWDGVSIEFKTSLNPKGFTDILSAIPGYMLDSVEYLVEDGTYTIKGKAYEKKDLPTPAGG